MDYEERITAAELGEGTKIVPSMRYRILHGRGAAALGQEVLEERVFLTITTYGMAARIRELQEVSWECLILGRGSGD